MERVDALRAWTRDVVAELAGLPETLAKLRRGATDFERVGRRLAAASESLEEVTQLYQSTIAESTRRSAGAADALRKRVEELSADSPERMREGMSELQRTFESMAGLNPFWPRARRTTDD